ncbi:Pentatricopeptide repeat-containing protein At3g18110 [Durusdinium trenchii]|uniref:Chloroplastic (Protein EMBRYO DEFECTIVE 1270) n=1 Tax=Durusdinium trenchii TaxID=1381693 RepID=A0ABP0JR37_9DINO
MLASRSERLRRERKADEKVERFNRMMDLCASAEDLHGTERIFQRLVTLGLRLLWRDKQEPNDLSLALLVAASAEAREIVRAEMWLRRSMVEEEEDSSAVRRFSSLVATSKGDLDDTKLQKLEESFAAALKECQPMSSVTKHLYEELLQCLAGLGKKVCARAADLDRAKSGWFQKIYDASLQPNILSFNNLLGACTMFGSVSEARAVLERMTKAQVSPDSFSYLWMIKVSGGKAAEACLEEARHQELKLDTGMYNAVFRAYLAEEETPETPKNVKRLFEQMELDEIRADGMSLSSLAYAYAMQNEVERAEDLIFQARQESGRQRPEFFACLLFAYARKRGSRSRKAERAFRDLVDSGLAPTPAMLRYLRMAMPTEAEQLMAELGVSEKSVCVGGGKSW